MPHIGAPMALVEMYLFAWGEEGGGGGRQLPNQHDFSSFEIHKRKFAERADWEIVGRQPVTIPLPIPDVPDSNGDFITGKFLTTKMPIHSHFLCAVSPVLAGLEGTKSPNLLCENPMTLRGKGTLEIASAILCWLHHQKVDWSVHLATKLAELSHLWDQVDQVCLSLSTRLVGSLRLVKMCEGLRLNTFLQYLQRSACWLLHDYDCHQFQHLPAAWRTLLSRQISIRHPCCDLVLQESWTRMLRMHN